jgi:hypothetical protein
MTASAPYVLKLVHPYVGRNAILVLETVLFLKEVGHMIKNSYSISFLLVTIVVGLFI